MERLKVIIPTIRSDQPGVAKSLDELGCANALLRVGLQPVFTSLYTPIDQRLAIRESAYGLLIPGGPDINPCMYGQVPHSEVTVTRENTLLDELQAEEIEVAHLHRKNPVVGVCRGLQAMAVVSGGGLNQHLPDIVTSETHGVSVEERDSIEKIAPHDVIVSLGTQAHQIYGTELLTDVVSLHHQSVRDLGAWMRVSGKSPAGVVEIAEHSDPDEPFYVGVQYHPDLDERDNMQALFQHFGRAVYTRAGINLKTEAA